MAREINFRCRRCGCGLWLRPATAPAGVACAGCGEAHSVDPTGALDAQGRLARCAVCACDRLYRQRDFNRKLGLLVVIVAAAFSVHTRGLSLLVAAAIDLGLYMLLPEILLCYHCEAIHRGFPRSAGIEGYDLATGERYESREWGKLRPPGEQV
jgi:hypothetical protein